MVSKALTTIACSLVFLATAGVAQSPYEIKTRADKPRPSRDSIAAQPGPPRPWEETDKAIPIAASYSGGISLGAYQSGVNWGLTQFLKVTRANPQYRAQKRLPEVFFAAMTGASAGNINAVLSAIEYCDTQLKPPEASLFWKMWVTTGWPQLFPADRSRDAERGLLDRTYLRNNIMPAVRAAMSGGRFVPGCRIPIGIVVTRLTPGKIPLDTTISLPAQRYVAMFEARVLRDTIHLTTPQDALLQDRSLGARMSLYHDSRVILDPTTVFDLVEASSAYPIAFAAKPLTYRDPDCQLYPPPHCDQWITEDFIDGGVFDNNPVGLAYKMFEGRDTKDFPLPPTTFPPSRVPRLLYVDPFAYRGPLAKLAIESQGGLARPGSGGFTSVIRLVTGFIPSARTYELQSFARAVVTAEEPPIITATTRAHPVIGSHLGAFAAFLGRPFREFDFAVGVSDAIHYVALQILCDPVRVGVSQGRRDVADSAIQRRECFRREYRDLVQNRLLLSTETQRVIGSIANRTDPDLRLPERTAASDSAAKLVRTAPRGTRTPEDRRNIERFATAKRLAIAFALEEATANLMTNPAPRCERADLFTEILCIDRFGEVMRDFGTPNVKNILREWADECRSRKDNAAADCLADDTMVDLVSDPKSMLRATFLSILRRLRDIEEQKKKASEQNFKFTVKSVEMAYRSTDFTVRRGFEVSPSSIAGENSLWWTMNLLPYYAGGGLGVPAFQFGWQPTFHFSRRLAFLVPVEFSYFKDGTPERRYHWYNSVSPGVGFKFRSVIVNQLQANLRLTTRVDGFPWSSQGQGTWEVGALVFAGKLRLTAFRIPDRLAGDRSFPYAGTLSLADTNGLLYWLTR